MLGMSRRAQLAEDQEHDLVRSVRVMYGMPVPPPPLTLEQLNFVEDVSSTVAATPSSEPSQQPQRRQSAPSEPASPPVVVVGRVISAQLPSEDPSTSTEVILATASAEVPALAVPPSLTAANMASQSSSPLPNSAEEGGTRERGFVSSFFGRNNNNGKGAATPVGQVPAVQRQQPEKKGAQPRAQVHDDFFAEL